MGEDHGSGSMRPGRILWLASYPRSGNTWLRLFLANLQAERDSPVQLNELRGSLLAAGRALFEDATGLDSSVLTRDETWQLRSLVYTWLSDNAAATITCKIHDALTVDARPAIAPGATSGAIYVVRNPLDVAVSFAHHLEIGIDAMIEQMASESSCIGGRGQPLLAQYLGSWSGHVAGWIDTNEFPVLAIRYEDMASNPRETFRRIATFAGVAADDGEIARAIDFSSRVEARRQEEAARLAGRPAQPARLFPGGSIGRWREELTAEQAARVIEYHRAMMERLGYVDA